MRTTFVFSSLYYESLESLSLLGEGSLVVERAGKTENRILSQGKETRERF